MWHSTFQYKGFGRSTIHPLCLWGLLMLVFVWVPCSMAEQPAEIEPLISVDAQNEPLGDVFGKISRETAYTFIIEDRWRSHPVKIAFQDLPLNVGLKRILANLNHVIVYESAHEIRIAIFGQASLHTGEDSAPGYEFSRNPIRERDRMSGRMPGQATASDQEDATASESTDTPEETTEDAENQEKSE